MVKKLRRKIVLINVLLVGVVLAGVFCALCVNSYESAKQDLAQQLHQALEMSAGGAQETKPSIGGDRDEPSQQPRHGFGAYVSVLVDQTGTVLSVEEVNVTMEEATQTQAVAQVFAAGDQQGMLSSLGLMYVKQQMPDGIRIVFADTSSITDSLQRNILVSSALFVLSLGVLFAISLWLSGIAVKPVAAAWQRQKQFVADASHELKTPLTVILANNNILQSHRDATVASQRQWLDSTQEEAGRMKVLIDQMLLLAKSDALQERVVLSEVALSDLLEEQLLCFEPVGYEKGITLSAQIEPGITLRSDAPLLRQLSAILLDNSIKYSPAGGTVSLTLRLQGGTAVFSVHNGGEPITQQDLPHLFDRFYRVDKARGEGGYGLGLAIARNIADTLKAKIAVQSDEQNGTTFTVTF